jgi:uracil-DNA glycosylase
VGGRITTRFFDLANTAVQLAQRPWTRLASPAVRTASERRELLKAVYEEARGCTRCPLHQTRTTVVFGAGNADADLMFIGEAPGANEDKMGLPFVGQAGKLLDKLLAEIELERADVFIANTLKCLRYSAAVQLADGSWERIGRLVRSRYSGGVMSVDADGHLVPRRVTGWHATPLAGRRVFRLRYKTAKNAGSRGRVGIQLTGDHPVLTERGYVPVEELESGDRVATGQGLTELARDVVCGTVLGDGCLPAKSSQLTFSHSQRQLEYARFKADLLSELRPDVQERVVAAVAGGDPVYPVVHVRTRADHALRVLRHDFYQPHKVVPDWIADDLNPRMLAFWFMDDGYTRIRTHGRRPLAEIATVGFSEADLQTLIRGLVRLGLPAKASRRRLYFDVPTTQRLSELIAPYVPESMRYKLHPDVESRIPFDPDYLEPGEKLVLYDDVEVEDITNLERHDVTFFCIDVEDTHNFVTAGGVVHNCRPPNNRDPQPNEIEACNDYLRAQVDLIEPTVICTLGNFSTKLLRADTTGISRLHGREEVRIIGPRAVRLYPLYHPAAALYTPSMLEALRADFHRIPELLALGPPEQPQASEPAPHLEDLAGYDDEDEQPELGEPEPAAQLGLF